MNRIMAELALVQAETNYGFEMRFEHVPGRLNVWADALSRLDEPGSMATVPSELLADQRRRTSHRGPTWWRTPARYAYGIVDDALLGPVTDLRRRPPAALSSSLQSVEGHRPISREL